MSDKETFMKNYAAQGGLYDPESYYNYHQACKQAEKDFSNATYSSSYNTQLVRDAKNQAFNKFLRR